MKPHIAITTTRGEVHRDVLLPVPGPNDIEGLRRLLCAVDERRWVGIGSGGKVTYIRASAIESIEICEEMP